MRKGTWTIVLAAGLICVSLLASACGGSDGGGKSIDADTIAVRYTEALFAGKGDEAKAMMLGKYEYKDEFIAHTDKALAVLAQYEGKGSKVASARPWRGGDSGEVDKRVEVQFEYRKKGSSAAFETGIIYTRVTSVGGGWGITDVVLAVPDS